MQWSGLCSNVNLCKTVIGYRRCGMSSVTQSSVLAQRQKGLTTSHINRQLDPAVSKLMSYRKSFV